MIQPRTVITTKRDNITFPSFSVILVCVALSVLGLLMVPGLTVSSQAENVNREIEVAFVWQGAGAAVVESEITSVVEGAINSVRGVEQIRSTTEREFGMVTALFKKGTDMNAARFEVGTRIRQLRPRLPPDSYIELQDMVSGRSRQLLMSYTIWSNQGRYRTVEYAERELASPLGQLDVVDMASASGSLQKQIVIEYDPDKLRRSGLRPEDIAETFSSFTGTRLIGTVHVGNGKSYVRFDGGICENNLEEIPLKTPDGRLLHLSDFAAIRERESKEMVYDRINGQDCITLSVYGSEGCNIVKSCSQVKKKMESIMMNIPSSYKIELLFDSSVELKHNIRSTANRAAASVAILLVFVFLVSRSWKYLFISLFSILTNLSISVLFYRLFDVEIDLFSLSGITVSLGMVIDTVIVMTDHYSRYRDRSVVISIGAALLTTVSALLVILLLPQYSQSALGNFVAVVSINLTVSLFISMMFVPALVESTGFTHSMNNLRFSNRRRIARISSFYSRTIDKCRVHRWLLTILSLGLFGLALLLFVHHNYSRRGSLPEETAHGILSVAALMPEGSSTGQMNSTSRILEEWLLEQPVVERFETRISGRAARFSILLKSEWRNAPHASLFRDELWDRVLSIGSASWTVQPYSRGDEPYSNLLEKTEWKRYVRLYGYDYSQLQKYARRAMEIMLSHSRITDAAILSSEWQENVESEYHIEYDLEKLTALGLDYPGHYVYLSEQTMERNIGYLESRDASTQVWLRSNGRNYFDFWHIENDMIGSPGSEFSLKSSGGLVKRKTGGVIERQNQEYVIRIGYDFLGNDLQRMMLLDDIEDSISGAMPFGFRFEAFSDQESRAAGKSSLLILLYVCIVIYMICAGVFESLFMPLCVIMLIPIGFIGIFIFFPICGLFMGKACVAAMVMMSGLVVNASIYMTCEMKELEKTRSERVVSLYIKAFNRKIIPTLLTILSTVLGLLPFIWSGRDELFYLTFAIGVIAGLLFSVPGLLFLYPLFIPERYMK